MNDELRRELARLNELFASELPGRLEVIQDAWTRLRTDRRPEVAEELWRHVHRLAGSAGSLGFPGVSRVALDLEHRLIGWKSSPGGLVGAAAEDIDRLLRALGREAAAGPRDDLAGGASFHPRRDSRAILVVEDDAELAAALATQLRSFGWEAEVFPGTTGVIERVRESPPALLILDVILPEGELAGIDLLRDLRRPPDAADFPVLVVSARDDFDARLAAVRSGGAAYLAKPFDLLDVADRVHDILRRPEVEPYRVLVVDDDVSLAGHMALVLRRAGMIARAVTDPREFLEGLGEAEPDLVLMDLHMPEVSGPELVAVLRQQERHVGLPVVFLSTETDFDRQLRAMKLGGDDFLTKPISDSRLVAAVAVRAERSRVISRLVSRDHLTGLHNHVALKDRLRTEVARAHRTGAPLSFAMADLDHFKRINDRHGHLAGDRVLRSAARLMARRVRESDVVGRYGGEEFGVILPDCRLEDAVALVDELRRSFSELRFGSSGTSATFSAGVAALRPGEGIDDLVQRADLALYRAKDEGRNRVLAEDEAVSGD